MGKHFDGALAAALIGFVAVATDCAKNFYGFEFTSVVSILCFGVTALLAVIASHQHCTINRWLFAFVIAAASSLILNKTPYEFKAALHFVAFLMVITAVSPLFGSPQLNRLRQLLWRCLIYCLRVITIISAIELIYLQSAEIILGSEHYTRQLFGFHGLMEEPMLMSPIAAIIVIDSLWHAIKKSHKLKQSLLWAALTFVAMVVMIQAGSRIAIAGAAAAGCYLLWHYRQRIQRHWRPVVVIVLATVAIVIGQWSDWGRTVNMKMQIAEEHGSLFYSRQQNWSNRWQEFCESPLYGIGFNVLRYDDPTFNDPESPYYHTPNEPASAWLSILSQTGVLGAICMVGFLLQLLRTTLRRRTFDTGLNIAMMIFFIIHGIAEGWILYAGALMFLVFWLWCGQLTAELAQAESVAPPIISQTENS